MKRKIQMSNFAIYLIGTVILAGGLGLAAHLLMWLQQSGLLLES